MVSIAGLRYEIAIIVEDHKKTALNLTQLSLLLNAATSLLALIAIFLFKESIASFFQFSNPNTLFLLPCIIWLTSSTETLISWRNREKQYKQISTNKVIISTSSTAYKLAHPFVFTQNAHGLLFGHVLGQLLALLHIARKLPSHLFQVSKEIVTSIAKKYRSFMLYSTPAALLNILAVNMPWFIISAMDSQAATGQFGNAYKLTYMPMSMVAMALSQVFFQQIARVKNDKEQASTLSHDLINLLYAVAVIPVAILVVWGDLIAPFILGPEWKDAGIYIQVTIVFYFTMILTSPFSSAFSTYNKLQVQLIYNFVFLVSTSTALYLGYIIGGSTQHALAYFAVTGSILRIGVLNYFFTLFGKKLVTKTIFAILFATLLIYLGFGIREGFI